MGIMQQLGDPVCLCQHHAEAYAEFETVENPTVSTMVYETFADGATIISVPITITERCCVVTNAATMTPSSHLPGILEIERPLGTIRTNQEDSVLIHDLNLLHHAAWEVLDPGTYTYYLVNRAGAVATILGSWIKAIASDCEG